MKHNSRMKPWRPLGPWTSFGTSLGAAAVVAAWAVSGLHAAAFAQDRAHFEEVSAQRCERDQRANPVNSERTDDALKAYCRCFAQEVALHTPSDILNTSRSAATPEQVTRLQRLTKQAGETCGDRLK